MQQNGELDTIGEEHQYHQHHEHPPPAPPAKRRSNISPTPLAPFGMDDGSGEDEEEDDEEEVVTFRIGGQHIPASNTASFSGSVGKENETVTPVKPIAVKNFSSTSSHHPQPPSSNHGVSPRPMSSPDPAASSSSPSSYRDQAEQALPTAPVLMASSTIGTTPLTSTSTTLNTTPPPSGMMMTMEAQGGASLAPRLSFPSVPSAGFTSSLSSPRPSSLSISQQNDASLPSDQESINGVENNSIMSPTAGGGKDGGSNGKVKYSEDTAPTTPAGAAAAHHSTTPVRMMSPPSSQPMGDLVSGLSRRLSAGLSMKYDAGGEHGPKYSQKEFDILVEKQINDLREVHQRKVKALEAQVSQATVAAQQWQNQYEEYERDISAELSTMEAAFTLRQKEMQSELLSKEIQLKAVTAQLADMQSRMDTAEREAKDAKKKVEEAMVNEERLAKEWTEKLEAEKSRRIKDVLDMKVQITKKATEQFGVAQAQYNAVEKALVDKESELSQLTIDVNQAKIEATEAVRQKEKLVGRVTLLEEEVASLQRIITQKDEELARQASMAENKANDLKATIEKITADKDLAIRDREQAYESLSRTAISLQEHKRKAEEAQGRCDDLLFQSNEHKQMCEELLQMVESLQQANGENDMDTRPAAAVGEPVV